MFAPWFAEVAAWAAHDKLRAELGRDLTAEEFRETWCRTFSETLKAGSQIEGKALYAASRERLDREWQAKMRGNLVMAIVIGLIAGGFTLLL